MLSTEGNRSLLAPPLRTDWVEMPSSEYEVTLGRLPEIEMFPSRSGCTPGARFAPTMGLVLLVARQFSARVLISSPDLQSEIVTPCSVSVVFAWALTSTVSPAADATCSCTSWRPDSRARRGKSLRTETTKPGALT